MSNVAGTNACASITPLDGIHHWHEWKIEQLSSVIRRPETRSPIFTVKPFGKTIWYFRLTHNVSLETEIPRYSLALHVIHPPKAFLIKLTLGIIDANKSFLHSYEGTGILGELNGAETFITFSDFRNGKRRYLNANTLTIGCKIILHKRVDSSLAPNEQLFPIPISQLSHDFGKLFNDAKTSDVIVTVGAQKFYAHRAILMARSSVFAAMLENQMQESIEKTINIDDLDAEEVELVLRFIYTDTSDLENKTAQLLYAAEKYDLPRLKAMCEKTLFKNISAETAADILMVADRYRAHRLKINVCRFIASNIKQVVVNEGYGKMEKNHPEIILEVVRAMK